MICPRLLLSDVVIYEVITRTDNDPMQSQSCDIIHHLIYIIYLYMYMYLEKPRVSKAVIKAKGGSFEESQI